jgi:FdhD protein
MKGASQSASVPIELTRFENGARQDMRKDVLAAEEPLEIRVEGQTISIVMRTPGHDRELVAGFLLSEGVIKSAKDVFDITTCVAQGENAASNAIDAALVRPESFDVAKFSRHVITSSSCGLCGATSIESILKIRAPIMDEWRIAPEMLFALPAQLARRQETFRSTGGLHACALFDRKGRLLALREDVGRHNALDKLIGWALLKKRTPLREHLVLLSGRASFEMVQKAHSAGIAMVAAISAPSSLAVEFARASGQTLAGFLRGQSMNVYAGAERLAG